MIPIIVICYNNYRYVKNTLEQLEKTNPVYLDDVMIMDNNSNDTDTIEYLKTVSVKVHYNTKNDGPWVTKINNKHIYDMMPDKFVLTDPDLGFNTNLPSNFIDIMSNLSDKHGAAKIGFALDISDSDKFLQTSKYSHNKNIFDFESGYWKKRVPDTQYVLYNAIVDTTFALVNKLKNPEHDNFTGKHIRIAGNFTAKHLPWYRENSVLSVEENYKLNIQQTNISTIAKHIVEYIDNNYDKVVTNESLKFVKKNTLEIGLSRFKVGHSNIHGARLFKMRI
jgi:hypothetical protein